MPDFDALFLSFQSALAGRYSLERELGRGGMGVVYLAREVRLDRSVAIKLLPPELARDAELRDRFMREASLAARLSHPNIVPIFSVDEIGGFVFYVMAHVAGVTLAERVASRGPQSPHEATRILREVAWALAYAHGQGIVHRDIKPANIMIENGSGRAMVMDFGIARLSHVSSSTAVGELLGTPEYMSPEQAGGEPIDGRSDLYSLGVTGFYALTGTLPFIAPTTQAVLAQHLTKPPPAVSTVARGVPRSVAQAIDRCLQKDVAARFANGEALADALAPARDTTSEIPVPVRVFLDQKRIKPLVALPMVLLSMTVPLVGHMLDMGANVAELAGVAALVAGAVAIPAGVVIFRLRRLLRLGYGPDDIAAGLRTLFARRREEFLFDFGAEPSTREKALRTIGVIGLAGAGVAAVAAAFGLQGEVAGFLGIGSLYAGAITMVISNKWRRMRQGRGSRWLRFWEGKVARVLATVAGWRLGQRAVSADRPTEMVIAMSAEGLYESFPKELRQSLGDVPRVLRDLEARARAVRARVEFLDASLLEVQSGRAASGERQQALVDDLRTSRAEAEKGLSDVVTALENLRLDLLRLRAGVGSAEGITRDVAAARELGEDVDRLLAVQREVNNVLKTLP